MPPKQACEAAASRPSLDAAHAWALPEQPQSAASLRRLAELLRRLSEQAAAAADSLAGQGAPAAASASEPEPQGNVVSFRRASSGQAPAQAAKPDGDEEAHEGPARKKQRKAPKAFDMGAYHQRKIALEVMYIGWGFNGSTFQPGDPNTIEGALLRALTRTRLVPPDASLESLQLSRSGRTDKGVSGLGQVIALLVRSCCKADRPLPPPEAECDFPTVLNRALPPEIRVLGWTDAPPGFSARFSTLYREYRYFIPCGLELNLSAMQSAAAAFVGTRDFRNFCKADAEHVNHFVRLVHACSVEELPALACGGHRLLRVHLCGSAFLWHQVRCMVAVLLLVGRGLEAPAIVAQMLDVGAFGDKPQYPMAAEEPLLLHACAYEGLAFRRTPAGAAACRAAVEGLLRGALARAALLHAALERLEGQARALPAHAPRPERHVPLARRARELPLEAKFAKFGRTLAQPAPGKGGVPVAAD